MVRFSVLAVPVRLLATEKKFSNFNRLLFSKLVMIIEVVVFHRFLMRWKDFMKDRNPGMSEDKIAAKYAMQQSTINKFLKGVYDGRIPGAVSMERIAKVEEMRVWELIRYVEELPASGYYS